MVDTNNKVIIKLIILMMFLLPLGLAAQEQIGQDINGEAAGDRSGRSVSLSLDGSRVAIGATFNSGNGEEAGHTRIFEWDGSAWQQLGQDIDGEFRFDLSGKSVSLSSDGRRVAIGAIENDGFGFASGHTRIFEWDGSAWQQVGQDIDGEVAWDYSGESVSLSSDGSRVAIGSKYNSGGGDEAGHTRIFAWNGSEWQQVGQDIDGETAGDWSGESVSLSSDGRRVAIGARWNDGNSHEAGHTRIFEWDGSAWQQVGQDINGEAQRDRSGFSVSLSSDGSRVAIGARWNDGNGDKAGHTRIFEWNGSEWQQVGLDIDGESAEDGSGGSVALSSDGSRVAIGAIGNDGNGESAGHVRVFEIMTSSNFPRLTPVELKVYPNPAEEVITIIAKNPILSIRLYDLEGCLVHQLDSINIPQLDMQLNLSFLPPGIYVIKVETHQEQEWTKISLK